jgi:hypothetical protein
MKKLLFLLLTTAIVVALAMPAGAVDSEFGGYWRTRAYTQKNFSGTDSGAQDITQVDTRGRLYYTAVFSDDLKWVNKFEWNQTWGDTVGGDIGTDGMGIFRIKNSYANFNLGAWNLMVGLQPRVLARGFVFDDDFAGLAATYNGAGFTFPFVWMKVYEGGMGKDANDNDVDYYAIKPNFTMGDMSVTPFALYVTSDDASAWANMSGNADVSIYFVGLDLDANIGAGSFWLTAIYESGSADVAPAAVPFIGGIQSIDVSAYLLALGAKFGDFRANFIYATGDDTGTADEIEAFYVPAGQSYYWAEIMGMGMFDNQSSNGSPANAVSNALIGNVGATFNMGDIKLDADLWYAQAEEVPSGAPDELGTEIDLKLTYNLMDDLKLEVIGAYLFADDATTGGGSNEKDPYEVGTRLSLSF